jgi:CO/xanthine dehydrogenase FAD-binding subunit
MTPHATLQDAGLGLVSAVAGTIADPQVRTAGRSAGRSPTATRRRPAAALLAAEATVVRAVRAASGRCPPRSCSSTT